MAEFTLKKQNSLNSLIRFCNTMLPMALAVAEFQSQMTDDGFLTGGANAITDADCTATPGAQHLTAALVNSAVAALATMTLSNVNKTTVRQASGTVLTPPGG